ncbi:ribosome small subunit-dependent GTPase A [uncultured Parolsenella sp.]|uniref:ribosome small subunit-dependent GTPase A n=1 Tax=uncultured Parolsenella sp. TaxID=2083008 RepID=UPI0027DDA268|nr:ribosome small subunit-dependent GTPase A [uncultured Parolsenella sp.]
MGKRLAKGSGKARRRTERGGVSRASGGRGYRGLARGEAAANVLRTLPATDELENVPAFGDLRADEAQLAAFAEACGRVAERLGEEYARTLDLGCVVRLDRGFPLVACEERTLRAEHSVDFAKGAAAEAGIMPTVGDWVAVAVPPDHDMGVIEEVLPRRSAFARWRGGRRGEFQTLAANLDEVIVVAALGEGRVPLDRIARSLVLVRDCGASCSVVLTKADRKAREGDLDADVSRVRRLVGEDVRVAVTSSAEGEGIDGVRALVPGLTVAMILGESGAGKSTLLNALLGQDALATGAVRERDDMGRHTTVARMMVKVPGAGVICDAPGLRSLPLVGHERGLALAFPEVAERARECRFRDCTHSGEPGCAVRTALEADELDAVRTEAYLSLASEMRESAQGLDPDVVL